MKSDGKRPSLRRTARVKTLVSASPWKLGQPVREIAEGGAAQDRDQAHARGSDTGPRVQTVQQKHYAGGGY